MEAGFMTWLRTNIDFPAVVFIVIMAMGLYVLWAAQHADNGFDIKEMLLDDKGKPSSARLGVFVSLATTTWALMYHVVYSKGQVNEYILLGYALIWSGSAVASKMVDGYIASKSGGSPPTPAEEKEK
jgi:hypothetical protein